MSKQFIEKKSDYLNSIGFLSITVLLNNKVIFSSTSIKDDEIKALQYPYSYPKIIKIDNTKFFVDYSFTHKCVNKYQTTNAVIPNTETGCLLKRFKKSDEITILLLGIYTELISPNDASAQLDSFLQQIIEKDMV